MVRRISSRPVGLDGDDLGPGDHDFLHDRVGEPEHAVDQVLFGRFEYTALASLPDEELDLVLRYVRRLLLARRSEQAEHKIIGKSKYSQNPVKQPGKNVDGAGRRRRDLFGITYCQRLGDQFTEHQGEIGDQTDDDTRPPAVQRLCCTNSIGTAARTGLMRSMAITPPKVAASVPIRVTPIWTVARNRSGSS